MSISPEDEIKITERVGLRGRPEEERPASAISAGHTWRGGDERGLAATMAGHKTGHIPGLRPVGESRT
jgi:hypothetical protein